MGDKFEMLKNCARFIDRRCEGGGWPTYRELEEKLAASRKEVKGYQDACDTHVRVRNEQGDELEKLRADNEAMRKTLAISHPGYGEP